ncbi:ATP/GTP-binding protein [Streptomyces sp. NRRL F-5727]|uniref:ATP/GTP-binding protein n=1 Tax=Streptomyces sp. NRRL F-5727 TaxID=1463871 RepID=UPI0004C73A72|nr:ATP/GTP-binding protein [Streptomyces sp. NRRL F-5727]
MEFEGTHGSRSTHDGPPHADIPRPAGAPAAVPPVPAAAPPSAPPRPTGAPPVAPGRATLVDWLRTPRPEAAPGIWRFGHVPRPERAPDETPLRTVLAGATISFLVAVLLWSLLRNGYIPYWSVPIRLFTPGDWWRPLGGAPVPGTGGPVALAVYRFVLFAGIFGGIGRFGRWPYAWNRLALEYGRRAQFVLAALAGLLTVALVRGDWLPLRPLVLSMLPYELTAPDAVFANQEMEDTATLLLTIATALPFVWLALRRATPRPGSTAAMAAPSGPDLVSWPDLRAAGLAEAADRLAAEAASGAMNDVDYARIKTAWENTGHAPDRQAAFVREVHARGAAAFLHPSGARFLAGRRATHDLALRQVRLGTVTDTDRNPYARRTTGLALDPDVLGTGMLVVGPSGSGKTTRLVRPLVESLSLQALAGQAAVVVVGSDTAPLGPDESYDVVIRVGDPASPHDLDLYGGTSDPDRAAALLADVLATDTTDTRRATTTLAQLLGPFHAVHGRFPSVPELRELLDGAPTVLQTLRAALERAGHASLVRELDARARQQGAAGDPAGALADRIALLDRPAFAGFFDTSGATAPFTMRALEHPVRVRIDLPESGHAEASRLLTRLVLAQFLGRTVGRTDRSRFACLVLDDAAHTLTSETVRGLQRLRSAHAGVVLGLRTVEDVPEHLRTALFGAVGCRFALAGITTWDGKRFAETWGTEWVETRDVTRRTVRSDEPLTRVAHAVRKLVTGRAVTTDAVTVREVERERWSASDLAHGVPPGHAVLSLTDVRGEHTPPLLVDLRS